jgi:hypothetical protein
MTFLVTEYCIGVVWNHIEYLVDCNLPPSVYTNFRSSEKGRVFGKLCEHISHNVLYIQ